MYMAPVKSGAARSYRNVDLSSRIEGATPHRLVTILFEELLKAMDAMAAAMRRSDYSQRSSRQSRAMSILHGLEMSLDHDRGGDIARDLALVYREARRLTMEASRGNDLQKLEQAREMVMELNSAWEAIGAR
jgi:flagellar protein FliS